MTKFIYEALSPTGELLSDDMVGENASDVIRFVEQQGWTLRSIRAEDFINEFDGRHSDGVSAEPTAVDDNLAFTKRLSATLDFRDELISALDALIAELQPRPATRSLAELARMLRSGATAEEFIAHKQAPYWLPILVRGVGSQRDGDGLLQFLSESIRESTIRSQTRRMVVYPTILFLACFALIAFMLVFVVPNFAKMFAEFGLQLPWATKVVVGASNQITGHPFQSLLVIAVVCPTIFALVYLWRGNALTTQLFGSFISGNTSSLFAMARFTRTLSDLLAMEASLPFALSIAGQATEHPFYGKVGEDLASEARRGSDLRQSSRACCVPENVLHALAIGQVGEPDPLLLNELSQLYLERAQNRFAWASQLVGPTTILAVGAVVAFIAIALFWPLFHLVNGLN